MRAIELRLIERAADAVGGVVQRSALQQRDAARECAVRVAGAERRLDDARAQIAAARRARGREELRARSR